MHHLHWSSPHRADARIVPVGPPRVVENAKSPHRRATDFDFMDEHGIFAVRLAPKAYALAWLGISLLHVVCATYLIVGGLIFWALPGLIDMYYIDFYAVALSSTHFPRIASVHFAVGASHVGLLLLPVLARLWTAAAFHHSPRTVGLPQRPRQLRQLLTRVMDRATDTHHFLFARTGIFGVQGRYYELLFSISEVLDIVLQTHQALQMSRQLPHRSLNRFCVATLVCNCLATPLIHVCVAYRPLQRLLCRLSDIALDFLASVVVPVELARRFYHHYDPVMLSVPTELWYDDAWFIKTLQEAPIVLFGSWLDAISRLVFSIGLIMSLNSLKNLLRPTVGGSSVAVRRARRPPPQPYRADVIPASALRILHAVMATFGLVVLGVHLHAEARASPEACALEIRPWLTAQPACALVEFNCFRDRNLNGSATEFHSVFAPLYTPSLLHIVFRHCPYVEIGPELGVFHELIGLKTYNSTLVTWIDGAAFTHTNHPHMRFAFFVRTNFANGELPRGMLSLDFPVDLRDIEISGSNLQRLPDNLHDRWPPGLTLVIEFSHLTHVPPTILRLYPHTLALDANEIREVPLEILLDPERAYSSFSGNPITALPENDHSTALPPMDRRLLFFAFTQLATLPDWMTAVEFLAHTRIIAPDTPLCQSILDARTAMGDGNEQPLWTQSINCRAGTAAVGYYPQYLDERIDETSW